MSKVYAVRLSSGFDYSVEFVCSTRETAEKLAAKMNEGDKETYTVEEYLLITDAEDVQRRVCHRVWLDPEGNVAQASNDRTSRPAWISADQPDTAEVHEQKARDVPEQWVWGKSYRSFDNALAAARALLAQIKAEQAAP